MIPLVVVREIQESDIPALAAILLQPKNRQWLTGTMSPEGAERSFRDAIIENSKASGKSKRFAVLHEGLVIGTVGIWFFPPGKALELKLWDESRRWGQMGRVLSSKFWGKGLGTEAGRWLIRYAFEVLELDGLLLTTGKDNGRARASVEKLGFARVAEEDSLVYYSLSKAYRKPS